MTHTKFQAAGAAILLFIALAGRGDKPETAFNEKPRGYVEFYMPETRLGEERGDVDTQVYRTENGKREFLGMTQLWKTLTQPRRGLTVTVPSGEQSFVVVFGSAEAPVRVKVGEGEYRRVRIEMTGLGTLQLLGTMQQLSFRLEATPEPAP